MGEDYHIYLHSAESTKSSLAKPFKRTTQKPTSPKLPSWLKYVQNPDSLVGVAISKAKSSFQNAIDKTGKAPLKVAIIMAALKIADSITVSANKLWELNTGRTEFGNFYDNMKNVVNTITHPFSSTFSTITTMTQIHRQDERRQLNAQLLGDSQINSNYKRQV